MRVFYFLVAFVFSAGAILTLLHQSGIFEIQSVPIDFSIEAGNELTIPAPKVAGMKERLSEHLKSLKGKRIWEVDLRDLRASIVQDEWIKDIMISRRLPNEVHVSVRPKNAALILVEKQDKFIPITEEGEMLGALDAGALPDVPLLRGEIFSKDASRRESAVKFVRSLREEGLLSRHNVSEISWSREDGYVLMLLQPKVEVRLGDEHIDLKVMRVGQVLNYLSANSLKGRVIDASFSKKVLVRLRKDP